jgi:hypothetical protein
MTARTRSALTPALVLFVAAALAYAISLIPTLGLAHGSTPAHAAAVVLVAEPAGSGSALDAPPVVTPADPPTVDEVSQLWRRGEYLGAGLLVLCGLLVFALKVDRRRAAIYTAGLAAIGGLVELVHAGQTPNASMLLGAALFFGALVMRSPLQPKVEPPPRTPESGHVALPLLGCVAVVFLAGLAYACAPARPAARTVADPIIDCTLVSLGSNADAYRGRIELAIRDNTSNGAVSWSKVVAVVADLVPEAGIDVAGCVARETFERVLGSRGVTASMSEADLRAGWDRVRDEALGGRRYLWAVP